MRNIQLQIFGKSEKLRSIQETVSRAKRHFESHFYSDKNIVSIGVGFKYREKDGLYEKDKQGDELVCLKFMVNKKIEPEVFAAEGIARETQMIPGSFKFEGSEILTDVEERNYQLHYKLVEEFKKTNADTYRRRRQDTLRPGISIAHIDISAGTLGGIVYDNNTYQPYVLSNWHVLSGAQGKIGDIIVQPGYYDDSRTNLNHSGKLVRSYLGMAGDCAIASIENRTFDPSIFGLDSVVNAIARVDLGDKVVKSGRTTAVTYGIVNQVDMTIKMGYEGMPEQATISGFEITPNPEKPAQSNEISKGGDSGSWWVIDDKSKKVVVGLHFAGEKDQIDDEFALSCYIDKVLDKLEVHIPVETKEDQLAIEVTSLENRKGFDEKFLGDKWTVKKPSSGKIRSVLKLDNGKPEIKYTNFSLEMNSVRKMAIYTACNVDGSNMDINNMQKVPRPSWKIDDRIGAGNQVVDEFYWNVGQDAFNRGHMVRRFDPMWSNNWKQAHNDTFFFTNAVPQNPKFNAGLWNDLEDWVLYDADTKDRKVNIFAGPIFLSDDEEYYGIKVPYYFWKILVRFKKSIKKPAAAAFIMGTQKEVYETEALTKRINFIPTDRVAPYQVTIHKIEELTGLDFGELSKYDLKNADDYTSEFIRVPKPIMSIRDMLI